MTSSFRDLATLPDMRLRVAVPVAAILLLATVGVVALVVAARPAPPRSEICGVALAAAPDYEWVNLGDRYGEIPPEHEVVDLLSGRSVPPPRSIGEVLVETGSLTIEDAAATDPPRGEIHHLGRLSLPDGSCSADVTSWSGGALRDFYPGLDGGALITIVAVRG